MSSLIETIVRQIADEVFHGEDEVNTSEIKLSSVNPDMVLEAVNNYFFENGCWSAIPHKESLMVFVNKVFEFFDLQSTILYDFKSQVIQNLILKQVMIWSSEDKVLDFRQLTEMLEYGTGLISDTFMNELIAMSYFGNSLKLALGLLAINSSTGAINDCPPELRLDNSTWNQLLDSNENVRSYTCTMIHAWKNDPVQLVINQSLLEHNDNKRHAAYLKGLSMIQVLLNPVNSAVFFEIKPSK
jgi:hypothetical protein